ncbi:MULTISPECIES: glycosyl-4,4'-diaponeurosporenoate acyltransferase [unclassified Sporolactobacillus]|uniref:glycosyl-4,4'-diaponeurosporenoate acyltransferase CrtO family protein n=1 Tax=unclassified Sporolactobacillus TaxID=2628533 RepID=UPI002367A490|nr:glycosyl-4,4'-diaponeurosporenoate acyltransferase [Sporolactobacillus sp. CQH2019]MDD9150632.1 glycosyl-4,4'-diaponeurosporenoate acyltransferase [Sporolactobacillus sp. CQH2019]
MKFITLFNNLFVFLIISVINTVISIALPISLFHYDSWLFRERNWEKNGAVYQGCLGVKKWKNLLPELSDFLAFLFPKKKIRQYSPDYLYRFVLETCRAELAHWCIIISSFIFIIWNGTGMSVLMISLAVVLNLPYIIIQRYNRPRILNILANKKNKRMIKNDSIQDI